MANSEIGNLKINNINTAQTISHNITSPPKETFAPSLSDKKHNY